MLSEHGSGTTRSLLRRARAGSVRALSALFRREIPSLLRWAAGRLPRWARRGIDTVDIVQDALIRTIRNLSHFEPQGRRALQAYLRAAVRNAIEDEKRRVMVRPTSVSLPDDQPDSSESPLERLLGKEAAAKYLRAVNQLAESDRLAIVGRIEKELSFDQMALLLGKSSADSARMHFKRALDRLAHEMARA